MTSRTKLLRGALVALAAAVVLIQFVPVARTNPPVTGDIPAPADAKAVIRRACYDCHSNESKWPWYSHVAPVSWLVTHDVNEARRKMNFSEWNKLSADKQARNLRNALEEIEGKDMPPKIYVPMHPDARLGDADMAILHAWITSTAPGAHDEDGD
ncbi:MAG: heme-binding domain-containing protein [bacterium]